MLYDLWYRISRTLFPFISLKRYHEICDDYETVIDKQFDCIESQAETIQDLSNELDANYPLVALDDIMVSVEGMPDYPEIEPIEGKSVTASGIFQAIEDDEYGIARMDTDGSVDPNRYGRD